MNSWLLGLVGVIFLGILLDLIYPEGKTNKITRIIFGLMAICIMVSPLLKLKNIDFNDSEIIDSINDSFLKNKKETLAIQIENYLCSEGVDGSNVEIDGVMSSFDLDIKSVYIDCSQIVLNTSLTNINKYEVIGDLIKNKFDIEESKIVMYG